MTCLLVLGLETKSSNVNLYTNELAQQDFLPYGDNRLHPYSTEAISWSKSFASTEVTMYAATANGVEPDYDIAYTIPSSLRDGKLRMVADLIANNPLVSKAYIFLYDLGDFDDPTFIQQDISSFEEELNRNYPLGGPARSEILIFHRI